MGLDDNAGYTIDPSEREQMGWISPSAVSSNTQINLHDYVNTGEMIKINLGNSNYLYVANHQFTNLFDKANGNYDSPGIYITKKTNSGYGSENGHIRQLSAKGNYDWQYMGKFQNPWGGDPNSKISAWKIESENPMGIGFLDQINVPNTNKWEFQHIYYNDDGNLVNDGSIHRCWGLYDDVFDETQEKNMLSKYTNPSIMAYGGTYDHYAIEVASENNGTYTINVYTTSQSIIDDLPPFRPMNIELTVTSRNHPQISWDANTEPDKDGYYVYRNENGGSWQQIAYTVRPYYTDNEVNTANQHDDIGYCVKAKDTSNKLSSYSHDVHVQGLMPKLGSELPALAASVPDKFRLLQNHPNPFNPTTTIAYDLPEAGFVKLTVFNVRGQLVKTLVNDYFEAGSYKTRFSGRNLPSGIYLYKISVNGSNQIKRMLLIK